jgi:hypothetical protein
MPSFAIGSDLNIQHLIGDLLKIKSHPMPSDCRGFTDSSQLILIQSRLVGLLVGTPIRISEPSATIRRGPFSARTEFPRVEAVFPRYFGVRFEQMTKWHAEWMAKLPEQPEGLRIGCSRRKPAPFSRCSVIARHAR